MGHAARSGAYARRAAVVALTVILASGCGTPSTTVRPTATAAPVPSATATPTPTPPAFATLQPFRPTPTPSGAPGIDSLPRSATVEQDGIRLTLALLSSPLIAGRQTLLTVTLENRGDRELRWSNDGCDVNAGVGATTDMRWPPAGDDLPKGLTGHRGLLVQAATADQPIWLAFEIAHLASRRFLGCADLAVPRSLAPGRSVTQQFIWDGQAARRLGPPPSGPVTITATFERWSRPGPGRDGAPVVATLDSWVINGRSGNMLSPSEIVDAALRDARFASIARKRSVGYGDAILEYDLHLGIWVVGFLDSFPDQPPRMTAAYVDPVTGEVIDVRQVRVEF